jgi:hypothetical protein
VYVLENGHLIEVDPASGTTVWQWHVWDHLIQDADPTKENYGQVADHPELIDLNYGGTGRPGNPDWNHINSIDCHEELDQVLLSVHSFSEIWVIDHSTSTPEGETTWMVDYDGQVFRVARYTADYPGPPR